ncbi:protein terminal ear1-like [Papaver somniferum]|nr:protein terminal ear1-like [Papaver somniferum]
MKMLLPSKKTVEETSDANDQIDNNTTLMIRNIPSKYTRQMLTNLLEDHCKEANEMRATDQSEELSAFDFLYLPIDFERGFNRGYAFVNMTNSTGAKRLRLFLNNYKWGVFQSKKICQVTDAKYQGKEALVTHFLSSYFECESDELLPRCFSPYRDGSGGLVEESTVGRFCGQRHPSK